MNNSILILDFGSQYTQLIARRVRELEVYCEVLPGSTGRKSIQDHDPAGIILSGGPASVYDQGAPGIDPFILESGLPILGICYGLQLVSRALGGVVSPSMKREYGAARISCAVSNPLIPLGEQDVWMSHGDRVETPPPGFDVLATSPSTPVAAIGNPQRRVYGVQFHPEVKHSPGGMKMLKNFLFKICAIKADWTPANIITTAVEKIRAQVDEGSAITAVSGGVDSTVATTLAHRALGDHLRAVFVDTGLLRLGEADQVEEVLIQRLGIPLTRLNAQEEYFRALQGVTEPEQKRRIIGEKFITLFAQEAARVGHPTHLVQGTIYPDVIESSASEHGKADRIKSHHNVGGLPQNLPFELVEPLRYLFKDEVRRIGEELGIPAHLLWRQPFPGPGLAVRCLGEITPVRVERLQFADAIFIDELQKAGLLNHKPLADDAVISQAFAALLPVRSVGVMGDQRTYQEVVALRAVTTDDFMTADWAVLPPQLLGRISSRIVNEVAGINRVVYDITSKPPGTIEWE